MYFLMKDSDPRTKVPQGRSWVTKVLTVKLRPRIRGYADGCMCALDSISGQCWVHLRPGLYLTSGMGAYAPWIISLASAGCTCALDYTILRGWVHVRPGLYLWPVLGAFAPWIVPYF